MGVVWAWYGGGGPVGLRRPLCLSACRGHSGMCARGYCVAGRLVHSGEQPVWIASRRGERVLLARTAPCLRLPTVARAPTSTGATILRTVPVWPLFPHPAGGATTSLPVRPHTGEGGPLPRMMICVAVGIVRRAGQDSILQGILRTPCPLNGKTADHFSRSYAAVPAHAPRLPLLPLRPALPPGRPAGLAAAAAAAALPHAAAPPAGARRGQPCAAQAAGGGRPMGASLRTGMHQRVAL